MRFYIYARGREDFALVPTKYIVLPRADAGFMGRKLWRKLPRRTCRRRGRRSPPLTATRGLRGHASPIGRRASRRPFAESTRDRIPGRCRVFPGRLRKIAADDDDDDDGGSVERTPMTLPTHPPLPVSPVARASLPPFRIAFEGKDGRGNVVLVAVLCVASDSFCIPDAPPRAADSAASGRHDPSLARDARFMAFAS